MDTESRRYAAEMSTQPSASGHTRAERRGATGGAHRTPLSASEPKSAPSTALSFEALRDVESWRLRVTAQVMIAIGTLALALTPLMGGDPVAKGIFVGGLGSVVLTMALLLRSSYASKYSANLIGAGGISLALANACALYYLGMFSLATMAGALGLYVFCLGSSTSWSVSVYAAIAVPHALLATLVIVGWIPDRGLVRANDLPLLDQVALQGCAQAVYAIALHAGRRSRDKLESAFGELEAAARVIAQRDALLNEAKRDLERAVRVGGDGRFSDQIVGSFRLGKVIGRGGMGEVYEAVNVESEQPAAVKLLHRNVIADADSLARFAREAKAAASFDSQHVVKVLEVSGEDSAIPYLAMERLRGEDLASMLRREQRLSSADLVELVRQVGRGLDEARKVGVIHRDIKPQNLFLARRDGAAPHWKILDFGVSKLIGHGTLTQNQLVGTPEYMAPEQAGGEPLDYRADLYSLAAVVYRCVASRAPFTENSLASLLQKVINAMPAKPSSVARVSHDVEAFLALGLAKAPADRFTSGAEFADHLRLAVEGRLPATIHARAKAILDRTPWAPA